MVGHVKIIAELHPKYGLACESIANLLLVNGLAGAAWLNCYTGDGSMTLAIFKIFKNSHI